jgi:hypothetical protein
MPCPNPTEQRAPTSLPPREVSHRQDLSTRNLKSFPFRKMSRISLVAVGMAIAGGCHGGVHALKMEKAMKGDAMEEHKENTEAKLQAHQDRQQKHQDGFEQNLAQLHTQEELLNQDLHQLSLVEYEVESKSSEGVIVRNQIQIPLFHVFTESNGMLDFGINFVIKDEYHVPVKEMTKFVQAKAHEITLKNQEIIANQNIIAKQVESGLRNGVDQLNGMNQLNDTNQMTGMNQHGNDKLKPESPIEQNTNLLKMQTQKKDPSEKKDLAENLTKNLAKLALDENQVDQNQNIENVFPILDPASLKQSLHESGMFNDVYLNDQKQQLKIDETALNQSVHKLNQSVAYLQTLNEEQLKNLTKEDLEKLGFIVAEEEELEELGLSQQNVQEAMKESQIVAKSQIMPKSQIEPKVQGGQIEPKKKESQIDSNQNQNQIVSSQNQIVSNENMNLKKEVQDQMKKQVKIMKNDAIKDEDDWDLMNDAVTKELVINQTQGGLLSALFGAGCSGRLVEKDAGQHKMLRWFLVP